MKLLLCHDCCDVVGIAPYGTPPRSCRCGRHFIWAADEDGREVFVADSKSETAKPAEPRISLIYLCNEMLVDPNPVSSRFHVACVLAAVAKASPRSPYVKAGSPVVVARGAAAWNVRWASLPASAEQAMTLQVAAAASPIGP